MFMGVLIVSGKFMDNRSILIGIVIGGLTGILFSKVAAKKELEKKPKGVLKYIKVVLYALFLTLILFWVYMLLATTVFLNWPADELLGIFALAAFISLLASFIGFVLYAVNLMKKKKDV